MPIFWNQFGKETISFRCDRSCGSSSRSQIQVSSPHKLSSQKTFLRKIAAPFFPSLLLCGAGAPTRAQLHVEYLSILLGLG